MTPNTTPEVFAIAREIGAKHHANKAHQYLDGSRDDYPDMRMIIDTIMEVTERAAKSIENRGDCDVYPWGSYFADELRNWEHLK